MFSQFFYDSSTVFTNYFYRKSVIALAVKMAEDLVRQQGGSEQVISGCADAVYLTMITLQGSTKTSGSGYVAATLAQLMGYSNDAAWWSSFVVSTAVCLALDATPWGVLSTVISTIGGEVGKDAALTIYTGCRMSLGK